MNRFEEIYSENYKTMFRVAKKMVGDSDDASDIVQEVFICLLDKLKNGHVIHHPQSWLNKTTCNKCVDYLRQQKRLQNIESLKDYHTEDGFEGEQEIRAVINNAISKLKPQERILAVLYSEGLSYKEIAKATGMKFSSVGKTISRTLKKLERELKNQKYELY